MRFRAVVWAILFASTPAAAQTAPNLDFEDGLTSWTASGDVPATPVEAAAASDTRYPATPLGGDYWQAVAYPLGHQGRFFFSTTDAQRGRLVSADFILQSDDRYLSLLIGGGGDPRRAFVELQVLDSSDNARTAWTVPAPGIELLQERVFPIPAALSGSRVRVAVIDDGADAHISVDDIRVTTEPPRRGAQGPVWGFADYHAHPVSYLAFGALRGVSTLWGRPGTSANAYATNPSLFELDLPQCSNGHGGGNTAGILINTLEKRVLPQDLQPRGFRATVRTLWRLLTGHFTRHPDEGAPSFEEYPGFLAGAHQQMHVTQVHRAWQGGLRLMVAVAVHNQGAEFLASEPQDAPPSGDREVLEAQVCAMRRLAALNDDWMRIAYSPAEARDIIRSGRLAVVVGAEFDRLGELGGFPSLADEVQYLWDLGIRQVTPIHGIDNRLGGAAVFEPAYNSLNDFLKRGPLALTSDELPRWLPEFFDVREGGCTAGALAGRRGECVLFKLSPRQDRVVVARTVFSPFSQTPTLQQVDVPRYRQFSGHLNTRGLTDDGRAYVRALFARGMLVGAEHMSQQSADDLEAEARNAGQPLLIGHAHFRALALQDRRRTSAEGFLPDEHDIGDRTLAAARQTGGVVGVFATENPIDMHPIVDLPFANDCAGSSKTFALSLLYAMARMDYRGVGLASDFTLIPQTAPRFGRDACWALKGHWDARPGAGPLRDQYLPERQQNGVRYAGVAPHPPVRAGDNAPLVPYRMGERTYDVNVDGLAHYGMLPDLLQDLKNIGVGARAFQALFSSAEAYLVMWEQAEGRATRVTPSSFTPHELPCDVVCQGKCP